MSPGIHKLFDMARGKLGLLSGGWKTNQNFYHILQNRGPEWIGFIRSYGVPELFLISFYRSL